MWSDHVFTNQARFIEDLQNIPPIVEQYPDYVVIVGHVPTAPETGLGYIEAGEKLRGYDHVFRVRSFKEKPDQQTADRYVAAGTFFWNMGYVSTRPAYLLNQLAEHTPELTQGLDELGAAQEKGDARRASKLYGRLPKISIDYALLEKTPRIITVTGDYGWSDVGSWRAVHEIFGVNGDYMPRGHHIHVDTHNNYIYNATDRAVCLIGVTDTIVVVTDDAVLVTHKAKSQQVKDVVKRLEEEGRAELL
jgi:mannose-1-phosphate guanylyltransferase